MKSYAAKSSAVRAAIAELSKGMNMTKEEVKAQAAELYTIEQDEDGKYFWRRIQKDLKAPATTVTGTQLELEAAETETKAAEHCPHCDIDLENGVCMHGDDVNGQVIEHKEFMYACLACGGEFGEAIPAPKAPKAAKSGTRVVHETSSIEKPCDVVWRIAGEMEGAARKDVVKACEEAGVATNTARTQYQRWFTAQKKAK